MNDDKEKTTENKSRARKYAYSKKQRIIMTIFAVLFLIVAIFAGVKIVEIVSDNSAGDDYYSDMKNKVISTTEAEKQREESTKEVTIEAVTEEPTTEVETEVASTQSVDFTALKELNSDVIAWIEIPGTVIDYPIVQGKDNNQYLRTLLDGSYHRFGTLFIDAANSPDFSDDITVIYGHHIYDGYMFCDVENYSSPKFYREHKDIWLYTPEKTYKLEPYCANIIPPELFLTFNFESQDAYQTYIDGFLNSTLLAADIKPDANYKTVVLFTCSAEERGNRYVLFCRLSEYEEQ